MENLIEKFLINNNYNYFNKKDINFQLKTHPDYPSFKSISDTLDYFSIKNIVLQVPKDTLEQLPKYFITLIGVNKNLAFVSKKNDIIVTYNENGKRELISVEEFKKIWSGTIIIIEENKTKKIQREDSYYLYPIVLLLFITYVIIKTNSLLDFIFIVFSLAGIFISILLIREKIGYFSPGVLKVCTKISKSSCTDVINSKGAIIYKDVSLADASFLFFSVLSFSEIFFTTNNFTKLMIVFAIPVIMYSIYYQAIILKKWCALCLLIGFINLILAFFYFYYFQWFNILLFEVFQFLFTFTFISILYFYFKKLIIYNRKLEEDLIIANRFKRNPFLLEILLEKSKKLKKANTSQDEIWIGEKNGNSFSIIAYTNPYCGFCKAAFDSYIKIINAFPDIRINFKFNTQPEDIKNLQTIICARLIEIYKTEGEFRFIEAFKNWFNERDENKWLKLFGKPKFNKSTLIQLKEHKTWSEENAIDYTPATILNDQVFPIEFSYEDLPSLINDIKAFQIKKSNI